MDGDAYISKGKTESTQYYWWASFRGNRLIQSLHASYKCNNNLSTYSPTSVPPQKKIVRSLIVEYQTTLFSKRKWCLFFFLIESPVKQCCVIHRQWQNAVLKLFKNFPLLACLF